jgi:hypothetical protein
MKNIFLIECNRSVLPNGKLRLVGGSFEYATIVRERNLYLHTCLVKEEDVPSFLEYIEEQEFVIIFDTVEERDRISRESMNNPNKIIR